MMSAVGTADKPLSEAVRLLVEALHPLRIYLFGSRARGEGMAKSDYDVLVLVEQKGGKPYQIEQRACRAIAGVTIPIEVVVMSRQHFERRREVRASLPATVERGGKLIYAA